MLVLSRKISETIVIDRQIVIKVLAVRGCAVRLGIEAPPEFQVRRGELSHHPSEDSHAENQP